MTRQVVVLPTLDGDPGAAFPTRNRAASGGADFRAQYERAVRAVLGVLDDAGLRGRVTWFLNEIDVGWSRWHPGLVKEISGRGDAIALHTHMDGLFGNPTIDTEEAVLRLCGAAKARLEALCGRLCIAHRTGCCLQRAYVYRALQRLGFNMLSDVAPGFCRMTAARIHLDNSMVPAGAGPYRHQAGDWLNYRSRAGPFLHVPLTTGSLKDLASLPDKVKRHRASVACWDMHPHEVQGPDGSVAPAMLDTFRRALERIDRELSPLYARFDQRPGPLG
ncbi:MAG: hypothetical protein JXR37_28825 [Kiritimatiellae bacterium]|nr:hypothetical protein [Kiritimatiellia bacterium]